MLKSKANPTFTEKVKVRVPGGEVHELVVTFKHKRKEDADNHFKGAEGPILALRMLDVIEKWDGLDFPLTVDGMTELDQEFPSVPPQLMTAYIDALAFGRVGN